MTLLRNLTHRENISDVDEIQSIINNLNNVLNSKRDYGFFLRDFGISDYHHYSSREDVTKVIIREVSENIERFEPRLELIKVVAVKDDALFKLSFRIDCVVRDNTTSLKLFMDPVNDNFLIHP